MELQKPQKDFIVTLTKNEKHSQRGKEADDTFASSSGLPKLPPKKNYIITADRIERPKDVTMRYVPKFHRVNVGNQPEVRYPVTSSTPEFGPASVFRPSPRVQNPIKSKPSEFGHKAPFIVGSTSDRRYQYWSRKAKYNHRQMAVEDLGEVWYPYLTSHPKYGSKQMILGQRLAADIYGSEKPTVRDIQETEKIVLGSLDVREQHGRPEWRLAYKGDGIYRRPDPNWCGRYVDVEHDLKMAKKIGNLKEERVKAENESENATYTKEVRFAQNAFNEKFVYTPQRGGQYIERSFNPRIQKRLKGKGKYVDSPFTPHYADMSPYFFSRDMGYYESNPYDRQEEYNVRYLTPIRRRDKYSDVDAKVKSFSNFGYSPGGGNKHYPTFKLNWRAGAKVSSFQPLKSKSYPNSVDTYDVISDTTEVKSEMEVDRIAESVRSHGRSRVTKVDTESKTSAAKSYSLRQSGQNLRAPWQTGRSKFSSARQYSPR